MCVNRVVLLSSKPNNNNHLNATMGGSPLQSNATASGNSNPSIPTPPGSPSKLDSSLQDLNNNNNRGNNNNLT